MEENIEETDDDLEEWFRAWEEYVNQSMRTRAEEVQYDTDME